MKAVIAASFILFSCLIADLVRCSKVFEYSSPFCSLVLDKENYNRRELSPRNCQLLHYRVSDVVTCVDILQQNATRPSSQKLHFAFIGDSRIRQQFFTLIEKLPNYDLKWRGEKFDRGYQSHMAMNASSALLNTRISFSWKAKIDEDFVAEFASYLNRKPSESKPYFILTGVGVHHYSGMNGLKNERSNYTRQLIKLKPVLQKLTRSVPVVWMDQTPVLGREDLSREAHVYNKMARQFLKGSGVIFWDSAMAAAYDYVRSCSMLDRADDYDFQKCHDAIHFGFAFESHHTETLLNYLCNKVLPRHRFRGQDICCIS